MRQALLEEWRAELARKPLGMSEQEACRLLEVSLGPEGQVWPFLFPLPSTRTTSPSSVLSSLVHHQLNLGEW